MYSDCWHVQLAGGEKPRQEARSGDRILCDRCGTGIADMYRSCPQCSEDVCLRCCEDGRKAQRNAFGQARLHSAHLCTTQAMPLLLFHARMCATSPLAV